MLFFKTSEDADPCPLRHPNEVIGNCTLCRKSVCASCLGTESGEKIICKFCLADIKGENIEKNKPSLLMKIFGFAPPPEPIALKLGEDEECHSGLHQEETTGTCQICKKSICPACTSPKTLNDKAVCNYCFLTIFQVRNKVKQEEQEQFIGGIREFFKFSYKIFLIFTIIFIFLFGVNTGILGIFHFFHPESFEKTNQSWSSGNYFILITKELPAVYDEMGERFWYQWWKGDGWRKSYEDWKKDQLEETENETNNDSDEE